MKYAGLWSSIHSFEFGAFCPIHTAKGAKILWEDDLDILQVEQEVRKPL